MERSDGDEMQHRKRAAGVLSSQTRSMRPLLWRLEVTGRAEAAPMKLESQESSRALVKDSTGRLQNPGEVRSSTLRSQARTA